MFTFIFSHLSKVPAHQPLVELAKTQVFACLEISYA